MRASGQSLNGNNQLSRVSRIGYIPYALHPIENPQPYIQTQLQLHLNPRQGTHHEPICKHSVGTTPPQTLYTNKAEGHATKRLKGTNGSMWGWSA